MRFLIVGTLLAIGLFDCTSTPEVDRQTKLLTMASDEAQQVTDPKDRLTLQLNFADQQIRSGHLTESRQSLARAAQTLRDSQTAPVDPLNAQFRIAGWVSVSELSRATNDNLTAESACDEAVAKLHALQPVSERPEYVVGVAKEVKELRGNVAATKLLVEATEWTKKIDASETRRMALVSIADVIFECKDYDAGLTALRIDPDAAWRSYTLSRLSIGLKDRELNWISNVGNGAVPGSIAANPLNSPPSSYNKSVDFDSVFKQK